MQVRMRLKAVSDSTKCHTIDTLHGTGTYGQSLSIHLSAIETARAEHDRQALPSPSCSLPRLDVHLAKVACAVCWSHLPRVSRVEVPIIGCHVV